MNIKMNQYTGPKLHNFPLLSKLGDINIKNTQDQDGLQFDQNDCKWKNIVSDFNSLKGVQVSNPPSNYDVLYYDSSNSVWVNGPVSAVPTDLDNLSDVNIASPNNNQILKYNSLTQLWANGNISLDDLDDVIITGIADGHLLQYDTTAPAGWKNVAMSALNMNLTDLNDVTLTGAAEYQVLTKSAGDWVNSEYKINIDMLTQATGQLLQYNNTHWVNVDKTTILALDDLTDVILTSPQLNDVLYYSTTAPVGWKNTPKVGFLALDDLSDVVITSATNKHIL